MFAKSFLALAAVLSTQVALTAAATVKFGPGFRVALGHDVNTHAWMYGNEYPLGTPTPGSVVDFLVETVDGANNQRAKCTLTSGYQTGAFFAFEAIDKWKVGFQPCGCVYGSKIKCELIQNGSGDVVCLPDQVPASGRICP